MSATLPASAVRAGATTRVATARTSRAAAVRRDPRAAHRRRRSCPVAVARAIAFVALAAWGALHWMSMLEPAEPGRGWLVVARRAARGRRDARAPGGSTAAGARSRRSPRSSRWPR